MFKFLNVEICEFDNVRIGRVICGYEIINYYGNPKRTLH